MKKVPSALKWLAEKRARVAGQLETSKSTHELICSHVMALAQELTSAESMRATSQAHIQKLTDALGALDQTVQIYDQNIVPEDIGVIHGWQGRYGKRGALREYLAEVLKSRAPEFVSTPELAFHAMNEFDLQFAHWAARKKWYTNSLRGALKVLEVDGHLERSPDLLRLSNDARSWRWKQDKALTLAELRA
ncbi:MAG: hypothetical protein M3R45_06930 [Pseudomonadota bacterium]|nr:hypothetical protein [Pseudomonadota bacterium]